MCGVYINCVLCWSVYLSVWLLVEERDGEVIQRWRLLWRLNWRGGGWLWVMYGNHAGGLEFRQVEAKFVLHSGKCSRSQAVTSDMPRVDRGKLRDARLGCWLRSSWAPAQSGKEPSLTVQTNWDFDEMIGKMCVCIYKYIYIAFFSFFKWHVWCLMLWILDPKSSVKPTQMPESLSF